jgi:isopenicillin-N epimerase
MPFRDQWLLEAGVTFLNHGSFGACPKPVLAAQNAIRERLERAPVRFMLDELEAELDRVRGDLARRFNGDAEGFAFVPNATTGVATVFSNLKLEPGDEVLVTNHAYGACHNVALRAADARQARLVVVEIPLPITDSGAILDRLLASLTPRTRFCLIDHVTSPTALVFPVAEIVRELQERGVDVLVDGAHAPGMTPVDLSALGAAYYTANFHKWCCAPKGAGVLYTRADRREALRPLVASHGMTSQRTDRSRYLLEFDWTGTQDPSPYLCIPAALSFIESLFDGGLPTLMERNRALALTGARVLRERTALCLVCPESMLGSMAALSLRHAEKSLDAAELHRRLVFEQRVEIPVHAWPLPYGPLLRLSAHAYNEFADYERLAEAVVALLGDRAG